MHDLLLAKHGIATPATHPLRVAVTRHKARLHAELTRARLCRGFASIEGLRQHVNQPAKFVCEPQENEVTGTAEVQGGAPRRWCHPRWVRINTLRTSLDVELGTTFLNYTLVGSLEQILDESSGEDLYFIDKHIPNLLALPRSSGIQKTPAFKNGLIVLQDKASCFPAYLLDPQLDEGDIVDACAAPGNKTTHLAALLQSQTNSRPDCRIWACERDTARALTLKSMIEKTGAQKIVSAKMSRDFLQINPHDLPWNRVSSLLLDPSCSGSGIIGRDDVSTIALPNKPVDGQRQTHRSAKRKRTPKSEQELITDDLKNENFTKDSSEENLTTRLSALSAFQLRLLLHAFSFPAARKITYSTCSVHAIENELVVLKALTSPISSQRGWRILKRDEQVIGARTWPHRGNRDACRDVDVGDNYWASNDARMIVAEACILCEKGTREGTQGFFVAGFVRDDWPDRTDLSKVVSPTATEARTRAVCDALGEGSDNVSEQEWEGFSDE